MIALLKRHWISISLLILSSIIGVVQYVKESPVDIRLFEYEFNTSDQAQLPKITQADTVFQYRDVFCRNYVGSVGDTLKDEGIRRFELKLNIPRPSKSVPTDLFNAIIDSRKIRLIQDQSRGTQKNRKKVLYWILFGLFLGMFVEFLLSLKRKPSSN